MKVIVFIPFPIWIIHSQVDMLLSGVIKSFGVETEILTCRNFYSTCPVLESKRTDKEKQQTCNSCQEYSKNIERWAKQKDIIFEKLDAKYLQSTNHSEEKINWDEELTSQEKQTLDKAALETTYTAHRTGSYGLIHRKISIYDKQVHDELRSFAKTISHHLALKKPDIAICFNGRFSTAQIFSRTCANLKIKCLIHEKGIREGSYRFYTQSSRFLDKNMLNTSIRSLACNIGYKKITTDNSIKTDVDKLMDRIKTGGKRTSHINFTLSQSKKALKADYKYLMSCMKNKLRIIGYFPSTFDENFSASKLPIDQLKLLRKFQQYAEDNKQSAFIVRLHPNFWLRKGIHSRDEVVSRFIDVIKSKGIKNLRIIDKNGITSSQLLPFIDGAIIPNSSFCQDARLLGYKNLLIVSSSDSPYSDCATFNSEDILGLTDKFVREINEHQLNKVTIQANNTQEGAYKRNALYTWRAENLVSIEFKAITSQKGNPFIPDVEKLNNFMSMGLKDYKNNISEDIEMINHIYKRLKEGKEGYVHKY